MPVLSKTGRPIEFKPDTQERRLVSTRCNKFDSKLLKYLKRAGKCGFDEEDSPVSQVCLIFGTCNLHPIDILEFRTHNS